MVCHLDLRLCRPYGVESSITVDCEGFTRLVSFTLSVCLRVPAAEDVTVPLQSSLSQNRYSRTILVGCIVFRDSTGYVLSISIIVYRKSSVCNSNVFVTTPV